MFTFIKKYLNNIRKKWILYHRNQQLNARSQKIIKQLGNCGERLLVFGTPILDFPHNISIGNHCNLNHGVYINARNGVKIGNDVTLSAFSKILSTGYDVDKLMNNDIKEHKQGKTLVLGDHCWIGCGAIILPGIKVSGHHVIIGAGSVVTKDIEENYVLVAGNPAKIVKRYKTIND